MSKYLHDEISLPSSLSRMSRFALAAVFLVLISVSAIAETPLTTLRHQTRELLKEDASLDEDSQAKDSAISSLCDLYVILRSDPRYPTSDMLRGDAAKIRRRLISIAERRENRLKREGVAKPPGLSAAVDQAVQASLSEPDGHSLGETEDAIPSGLAGAPLGANPWELVELIQRVIAPDFWDVQGGTGTIQYFAMRRVLVVRATSDVHEQIRDLLMALR